MKVVVVRDFPEFYFNNIYGGNLLRFLYTYERILSKLVTVKLFEFVIQPIFSV